MPKRSGPRIDPAEGIRIDRTYRRSDLKALIGCSDEFVRNLEAFYGLQPLGDKQAVYFGQNAIEALIRHAKNEQIRPGRRRQTRPANRRAPRKRTGP